MFALVSGQVDGWAEAPPIDCLLPLTPAARSGWLLAEATRRSQVLAAFPPPAVSAQDRVAAAPGTARPGRGQDAVLALADGRRTPATWRSPSAADCTRRCFSWPGCGTAPGGNQPDGQGVVVATRPRRRDAGRRGGRPDRHRPAAPPQGAPGLPARRGGKPPEPHVDPDAAASFGGKLGTGRGLQSTDMNNGNTGTKYPGL